MKKILVTGATGFIGSYVIEELLRCDQRIIASSSRKRKAEKKDWFKKVEYIPLDFNSLDGSANYYEFFHRPEILIHLAWEGLPDYQSSFHEEVNFPRHFSLLSNMIHYGLSDLTVTGTCLEYGLQEGRLSEDMPALPITAYGKAKNKLRNELEKIKGKAGLNFKWVRLFYMYGKGQNPNSLLSQLDKALSNEEKIFNMSGGRQLRDFLPVEKVAKNIVTIALQRNVEGIINCSSAEPLAVLDFVRKYLRQKGKDIALNPGYYPYPDYEPMGFWGDNTKLKSIIKE